MGVEGELLSALHPSGFMRFRSIQNLNCTAQFSIEKYRHAYQILGSLVLPLLGRVFLVSFSGVGPDEKVDGRAITFKY